MNNPLLVKWMCQIISFGIYSHIILLTYQHIEKHNLTVIRRPLLGSHYLYPTGLNTM